jgi:hypothetical protein
MLNFRPTPVDQADTAAGDEALLDRVVEAALIEAAAEAAPQPGGARPVSAADTAEVFLQRAAAFLNARPHGAALLERLRGMVSTGATEPQPELPGQLDASACKLE